jgi:hypothetical protein
VHVGGDPGVTAKLLHDLRYSILIIPVAAETGAIGSGEPARR